MHLLCPSGSLLTGEKWGGTGRTLSLHYLGGACWWCWQSLWPWPCWSGSEHHISIPALLISDPWTQPAHDLEMEKQGTFWQWSVFQKHDKNNWADTKHSFRSHVLGVAFCVTLRLVSLKILFKQHLMVWGSSLYRCSRSGCIESVWWGGCCALPLACCCPAPSWGPQLHCLSSSHWTAQMGPSWTEFRRG